MQFQRYISIDGNKMHKKGKGDKTCCIKNGIVFILKEETDNHLFGGLNKGFSPQGLPDIWTIPQLAHQF